MPEVGLELLAAQMQRMLEGLNDVRAEVASMRSELAAVNRRIDQRADESIVLTGLVMRYAGEHIAWGGVQNERRRIRSRLDMLEVVRPG